MFLGYAAPTGRTFLVPAPRHRSRSSLQVQAGAAAVPGAAAGAGVHGQPVDRGAGLGRRDDELDGHSADKGVSLPLVGDEHTGFHRGRPPAHSAASRSTSSAHGRSAPATAAPGPAKPTRWGCPRRATAPTPIRYFHGCYSLGDDQLWGINRRRKGGSNTLAALQSIRAARPDGAPIYVIMDNLSPNKTPAIRTWAARNKVELCSTPTYASWANPIEAPFGPLRTFTMNATSHPNHPALARRLQAYLRWRNQNARHPDVLAAQRRERARIRSERHQRWAPPTPGRMNPADVLGQRTSPIGRQPDHQAEDLAGVARSLLEESGTPTSP